MLTDGGERAIGPAWCADIAHLRGAPKHLAIRAPISADSGNRVHVPTIRRALGQYRASDFVLYPVVHGGLEHFYSSLPPDRQAAASPNAPLGYSGDPLLNEYIHHYSLTTVSVWRQLGPNAPHTVWCYNEPNLGSSDLQPGDLSLMQVPGKQSALAPEVFGAMLHTFGSRMGGLVDTVWPACLSISVRDNTDPEGPWVAGYLRKAFDYLESVKAPRPWPFKGLGVNCEGLISEDAASSIATALRNVMSDYGLSGPLCVGEWGGPNDGLVPGRYDDTYRALSAHFDHMFFFSHNVWNPSQPGSYGTAMYSYNDTEILPGEHLAWYPALQSLYTQT